MHQERILKLICKYFVIREAFDASADGSPRFAFSDGFNSSPLPFPCSIKPRSSGHAKVIEQEAQGALKSLRTYTVVESKVS